MLHANAGLLMSLIIMETSSIHQVFQKKTKATTSRCAFAMQIRKSRYPLAISCIQLITGFSLSEKRAEIWFFKFHLCVNGQIISLWNILYQTLLYASFLFHNNYKNKILIHCCNMTIVFVKISKKSFLFVFCILWEKFKCYLRNYWYCLELHQKYTIKYLCRQ